MNDAKTMKVSFLTYCSKRKGIYMKKYHYLVLTLILCFLLSACGSTSQTSSLSSKGNESQSSLSGDVDYASTSESSELMNSSSIENKQSFDQNLIGKTFMSGDYEYTVQEDGTVYVSGYTGDDTAIELPENLDNYEVTGVGDHAFEGSSIVSLVVPGQIKNIGYRAFYDCDQLTEVVLEDGVESVGEDAFVRTSISQLSMTNSVYKMGRDAFYTFIPDEISREENGLIYIGNVVVGFADDFGFFDEGIELKFAEDTVGIADYALCAQYNDTIKASTEISYIDTVEFPNGLKYIGKGAFLGQRRIDNYIIHESVVDIGDYAMYYEFVNGDIELIQDIALGIDNPKIYGTANSAAEQYAIANGITFVTMN